MIKQERIFRISGNNQGLACPFTPILCHNGRCAQCQVHLDWRERGEKVVICGYCGRVMRREPDFGQSVLLVAICDDCEVKNAETAENIRDIEQ